jgi:hypothetical protein
MTFTATMPWPLAIFWAALISRSSATRFARSIAPRSRQRPVSAIRSWWCLRKSTLAMVPTAFRRATCGEAMAGDADAHAALHDGNQASAFDEERGDMGMIHGQAPEGERLDPIARAGALIWLNPARDPPAVAWRSGAV